MNTLKNHSAQMKSPNNITAMAKALRKKYTESPICIEKSCWFHSHEDKPETQYRLYIAGIHNDNDLTWQELKDLVEKYLNE